MKRDETIISMTCLLFKAAKLAEFIIGTYLAHGFSSLFYHPYGNIFSAINRLSILVQIKRMYGVSIRRVSNTTILVKYSSISTQTKYISQT